MLRRAITLAATAAAALALLAPGASALPDTWTQWLPAGSAPMNTWIRSLDFTPASTLVASSDGDGVYQSPATLGPWTQTNSGLSTPGDLQAFQVVASGGKLYAATADGLFTS